MRAQLGSRLPEFTDAEFALLRETKDLVDFYGQNYYTAQYARHRDDPAHTNDYLGNVIETQTNKQGVSIGAESGIHWLRSSPPQFRKFFSWIYSRYGRAIYVTENGCPCPGEDKMSREESVNDQYRIDYFEAHLDAISQAIKEDGVDIKGYFAWSLFDNLGMFILIFFILGSMANSTQSGRVATVFVSGSLILITRRLRGRRKGRPRF